MLTESQKNQFAPIVALMNDPTIPTVVYFQLRGALSQLVRSHFGEEIYDSFKVVQGLWSLDDVESAIACFVRESEKNSATAAA